MSELHGRPEQGPAEAVRTYIASLPFDRRLYQQDVAGSMAHARMLARQGIISEKDAELLVMGLAAIRGEIERGEFPFRPELEDIHMNIEARLIEKLGDPGRKLHTARSRNDQIAVDLRLYLKVAIEETVGMLRGLQRTLVNQALAHKEAIMPGYTHLQRAQPVLLAHHLLAYFEMFQRDIERFQDCLKRTDVLPLGSGALAGVPYPVDRAFLARELGFAKISANSMDAVSDRDFILEYQSAAAIAMMHLSRLAEEVVLWSTAEFDFIELDQAYTTGSSIMPQKKNPDVAELLRGKTGRVYGHLMALLTTMKGLPLTYNRDLQEDKEGLFDTVDTLLSSLDVCAGMVTTLKFKSENTRRAAEGSYVLATDIADYLVGKGLPFRQAHEVVSRLVGYAARRGKSLARLTLKEYQRFSDLFQEDVCSLSVETSVAARRSPGGTAPERVEEELSRARRLLDAD